ncbi:MAG: hydroxyphenylacetyl-CoA thioesterase PaaI [Betaproteobacteria bacterium]
MNAPSHHEPPHHPPPLSPDDAQLLAQRCADAMYVRDRASQALGMRILNVAPGSATLTMTVRDDMLNGHASCHGGFIFSLADSAFAFACNSRNLITVAAGCSIEFLAPARAGDVLMATGCERALSGRSGIYDIDVTNQHGTTIAVFRGKSTRIKGNVIDGPQSEQKA